MSEIRIERKDNGETGAYVATAPGIDGDARLNFRKQGPDVIAAVHTETNDGMRGKGVGQMLVERMVEDARKDGIKIRALCSFVDGQRQKHPEWADVFVTG